MGRAVELNARGEGAKGEEELFRFLPLSSPSPFAPSPHAFSSTARPMLLSISLARPEHSAAKQHGWEDTELPAEEATNDHLLIKFCLEIRFPISVILEVSWLDQVLMNLPKEDKNKEKLGVYLY